MALPNVMADMSVTAASNTPAGTEAPTNADDYLRSIQAILRTTNAKGSDIASASTTDIGAATAEFVDVTGTTTITALGTIAAGIVRTVRFTGALTLTHNATSLILPGSANITTANGDCAIFRSLGSGNWKCIVYQPVSGSSVAPTFVDSSFRISGSSDATKLLAFEVDTNQSTATTRTITTLNVSGTNALIESLMFPITAVPGSNTMVITLNPCAIAFRSSTLASGTVNVRAVNTAITTTISSGSTGGSTSTNQSRIMVLAIDNAGTVELAWCNAAGANNLDEATLITTTAEGGAGAADSADIIYSTTARTSVPFRIVGYFESTQATAGTWVTAPSTIQGWGGQSSIFKSIQSTLMTSQATTSGTTKDFTIPSWATEITVMVIGVSTNGTSALWLQIGDAGGIETSNYIGAGGDITAATAFASSFILVRSSAAAGVYSGVVKLNLSNQATNTWSAFGIIARSDTAVTNMLAGYKSLSQSLTTVRLTSATPDTFDLGEVDVSYR